MIKNGDIIYFVCNCMDIKSDCKVSNIWLVNLDGKIMLLLMFGVYMDYLLVLLLDEMCLVFIFICDGSS